MTVAEHLFRTFGMVVPSEGRSRRLLDHLVEWQQRSRERQQLARLDERALKDVGLTRIDVARECAKPFWRA